MKTVILCGGRGSRLSEETDVKPKPMVEVGGRPILWHIMKYYHSYGFREFFLALGYKGEVIKDYFLNYHYYNSNLVVDLKKGSVNRKGSEAEDWRIHLTNTGLKTLTGGRLRKLKESLKNEESFMLTYGDGVGNIDIERLVNFHRTHNKIATVTAVRPIARFGNMSIREDSEQVFDFKEKRQAGDGWINGGFFVFRPGIFDYLSKDEDILEGQPLERLAKEGELVAYRHTGFWKPMDTLRDRNELEEIWHSGDIPWRRW